jgi:hypothetical protein
MVNIASILARSPLIYTPGSGFWDAERHIVSVAVMTGGLAIFQDAGFIEK